MARGPGAKAHGSRRLAFSVPGIDVYLSLINIFIKKLYGEETRVRFRPHHFPYTEPSAEMDMSCFKLSLIHI